MGWNWFCIIQGKTCAQYSGKRGEAWVAAAAEILGALSDFSATDSRGGVNDEKTLVIAMLAVAGVLGALGNSAYADGQCVCTVGNFENCAHIQYNGGTDSVPANNTSCVAVAVH